MLSDAQLAGGVVPELHPELSSHLQMCNDSCNQSGFRTTQLRDQGVSASHTAARTLTRVFNFNPLISPVFGASPVLQEQLWYSRCH